MINRFRVVGISYKTSSIEIREKLSLSDSDCLNLLGSIRELFDFEDALILSTCNRTEIYYSSEADQADGLVSLLCLQKQIRKERVIDSFWREQGEKAVSHIYSVAMGLDAKVLGDTQISNQVKRAYQNSADENVAGPFLHRLMHSIFYANKRLVQETTFRDGAASTSYVSVALLKQFVSNFNNPKVLVIGLGEIGNDVVDNLSGENINLTIATRDSDKAHQKALEKGFEAISLDEAISSISEYNAVISSLAVSKPIITDKLFGKDGVAHKLLIDLSVPRSISPDLGNRSGFILYNIDQLEEKTSDALRKRKEAIPDVEKVIRESITDLNAWILDMSVSPTIQKLKSALEDIRQEEIKRYLRNSDLKETELIEKVTKGIIQKVIKLPVLELKAACKRGEADTLVEVLNDLFDLEKDKIKSVRS